MQSFRNFSHWYNSDDREVTVPIACLINMYALLVQSQFLVVIAISIIFLFAVAAVIVIVFDFDVMLHSDCSILAIVSIVSLRSEVEHVDFNESIHTVSA